MVTVMVTVTNDCRGGRIIVIDEMATMRVMAVPYYCKTTLYRIKVESTHGRTESNVSHSHRFILAHVERWPG